MRCVSSFVHTHIKGVKEEWKLEDVKKEGAKGLRRGERLSNRSSQEQLEQETPL